MIPTQRDASDLSDGGPEDDVDAIIAHARHDLGVDALGWSDDKLTVVLVELWQRDETGSWSHAVLVEEWVRRFGQQPLPRGWGKGCAA